eukprot:m.63118 g.63118  ORF g.63118 m.63118 type:complete len:454 (-) comp23242_c0_seq1:288-1649(-)
MAESKASSLLPAYIPPLQIATTPTITPTATPPPPAKKAKKAGKSQSRASPKTKAGGAKQKASKATPTASAGKKTTSTTKPKTTKSKAKTTKASAKETKLSEKLLKQSDTKKTPGSAQPTPKSTAVNGGASNTAQATTDKVVAEKAKERKRKRLEKSEKASTVGKEETPKPPKRPKFKYLVELENIMTVQGFQKANDDTVKTLEDVIKSQVVNVVHLASESTRERNARNISTDDLLFGARRDPVVSHRLVEFVAKKEAKKKQGFGRIATRIGIQQRSRWLLLSSLNDLTSECTVDFASDELEAEVAEMQVEADELTKHMQVADYKRYAEAKKGMSFTLKKGKRFREWINLQLFTDLKANDDFYETLGHITWLITVELLGHVKKILVVNGRVPSTHNLSTTNATTTNTIFTNHHNDSTTTINDSNSNSCNSVMSSEHIIEVLRRLDCKGTRCVLR